MITFLVAMIAVELVLIPTSVYYRDWPFVLLGTGTLALFVWLLVDELRVRSARARRRRR